MKSIFGKKAEVKSLDMFKFEILSENELLKVRGGTNPVPKTRDKDIFEEEDE